MTTDRKQHNELEAQLSGRSGRADGLFGAGRRCVIAVALSTLLGLVVSATAVVAQTGASPDNGFGGVGNAGFLNHSYKHCTQFRTGKFRYDKASLQHVQITRKGDEQIEFDPIRKIKFVMAITWQDDCNYILTVTKVQGESPLKVGDKMKVEIIGTQDNRCRMRMDYKGEITEFEMQKIEG